MKTVLIVLFLLGVAFFTLPMESTSSFGVARAEILSRFNSLVTAIQVDGQSDKERQEYLLCKQEELAAYEKGLREIEASISQSEAEAASQICPQTGQPGVFILNDDPRPDLRTKIAKVKEEIRVAESR